MVEVLDMGCDSLVVMDPVTLVIKEVVDPVPSSSIRVEVWKNLVFEFSSINQLILDFRFQNSHSCLRMYLNY